jgi:hypothetical protein
MVKEEVVLVKCWFSRGGFPTEAVFHLETPGGEFTGAAPAEYCLDDKKEALRGEISRGEKVGGFVVGVRLGEQSAEKMARVHLPDGEIYDLPESLLIGNGDLAHVSLQP